MSPKRSNMWLKSKLNSLFLILVFLFSSFASLSAQDDLNKWAFDFGIVKNEYRGGETTNGFLKFGSNTFLGLESGVSRYINTNLEGTLQLSYGSYGYQGLFWSDNRFDAAALLKFKLNNGAILPKDSKVAPFVYTGVGITSMSSNKSPDGGISVFLPIGAGVKYALSDAVALQYHFSFNLTNEDIADGTEDKPTPKGDNFLKHTISLVINFGKVSSNSGCGCTKSRYRR